MPLLGGVRDVPDHNSAETEELARFAVQEHNKKANTRLEFSRVVKAKEQVVAGTMYYITLEVVHVGLVLILTGYRAFLRGIDTLLTVIVTKRGRDIRC
ncbi:hypothetical protein AAC387_Pa03g1194 [Persea americana]